MAAGTRHAAKSANVVSLRNIPPYGIERVLNQHTIKLVMTDRKTRRSNISKRLARIEGQVRGLSRMIDEDRYCIDVITQTKAVTAALKKVEAELLKDHASNCLAAAIASDDVQEREQKVSELVELLQKSAG